MSADLRLKNFPLFRFTCWITIIVFVFSFIPSCHVKKVHRETLSADDYKHLNAGSPYLKIHMHNGQLYILTTWLTEDSTHSVSGDGTLLGINRDTLQAGRFVVPIDSVAIFETNVTYVSGSVFALGMITAMSLAFTAFCIANPKACFGSCPTFYAGEGDNTLLAAEGFSSSIAPSLEASDIDALYRIHASSRDFQISMKNEALETHIIRYADLLIAPRPDNGRIIASKDGSFYEVTDLITPAECVAPEGDIRNQIISFDGYERFSEADSLNLASKEMIDLQFNRWPDNDAALVIASRQSLLSTYLFYQTLAYMGSKAGEWYALLERGNYNTNSSIKGIGKVLGGIEILLPDGDNNWSLIDEIHETGPLAADIKLIPLPRIDNPANQVRIRLNKGHWRLDYIALTELGNIVEPTRLSPRAVFYESALKPEALEILLDSTRTLVTLPGDQYTLSYTLPEDFNSYELFLESRGYYMEWMRQEWLKEENAAGVMTMLFNPEKALIDHAGDYKAIEREMEDLFWNSRYAKSNDN